MFKLLYAIPKQFLLACSGGIDSMVALDFLSNAKRTMKVIHINHGTEHAKDAEKFVTEYCSSKGIELKVHKLDCRPKEVGDSQEAIWHDYRNDVFQNQEETVVTAHQLSDAIEWWIFTALRGNPCLMPDRNNNVIRPFLASSKIDILSWAKRKNVPYIEDPSNTDIKYSRNIIRHNIIEQALKVNPGLETMMRKKLEKESVHLRNKRLLNAMERYYNLPIDQHQDDCECDKCLHFRNKQVDVYG